MSKQYRGQVTVEYDAWIGWQGARRRLARDVSVLKNLIDKVWLVQIYLAIKKSFYVESDVVVQDALVFDVEFLTDVTDSWSIDACLGDNNIQLYT